MYMFSVRDKKGQSLIEVLVGIAIGSLLISAATFGVAYVLRASRANQNIQTANLISQELLNNVRTFGEADWFNIASLTMGTSSHYFFANTGTSTLYAAYGEEGIFDDDPAVAFLTHRWGMDEKNTNEFFDSIGLYTSLGMSAANGVSHATSSCKISGCFRINETGAQEQDVVYAATAFSGSPVSISFFIKPEGVATSSAILKTVQLPYVETDPGFDLYTTSEGGVRARFFNGSGGTLELTNNEKNIFDNAWHLITATYDDAVLRLYIDDIGGNTASGSGYFPAWNPSATHFLFFGFSCGSSDCETLSDLYRGYMDDVRFYNRVLTIDEVKRILKAFPFIRYFSISDVCRTNDASSTVVEDIIPPCGSNIADPTTKKIIITTSWATPTGNTQVTLTDFITRWKNKVFLQSDWAGGTQSEDTVLTKPNDRFASSTGLDITSGGSIKLLGF